jgi:AraC-like DNA-binding protein
MLVAMRAARPPLDASVELLWLYESSVTHAAERLLPTGSMELVITLEAPQHEALIAGAYSRFAVLDTSQPALVLGAHFRPGGAYPFLRMPAGELHNLDVALEDLWGAAAARLLRERLCAAPSPEAKFAILEQAMIAQATTLERNGAVAWAVGELKRSTVARVTSAIGMSGRGFIEAFRRETGYTPKVYARIQRFQRLLRRVHRTAAEVDWSDAALACGYYDQSHLIRDFRAFSGLSPSDYLARRTEHLNHVPM